MKQNTIAGASAWKKIDSVNCVAAKAYSRAIEGAHSLFSGECKLSESACASSRKVKMLTGAIGLSKKAKCEFGEKECLTAQHHFALRLLYTEGIKKTGEATGDEVTDKLAFICDGAKAQGTSGSTNKQRREQFQALIKATNDSDLHGLPKGYIFPLTQLPELLRRLIKEVAADFASRRQAADAASRIPSPSC
jgi:hypothetical protein